MGVSNRFEARPFQPHLKRASTLPCEVQQMKHIAKLWHKPCNTATPGYFQCLQNQEAYNLAYVCSWVLNQIKCYWHEHTRGDVCATHLLRHWSRFAPSHTADIAHAASVINVMNLRLAEPLLHFCGNSQVHDMRCGGKYNGACCKCIAAGPTVKEFLQSFAKVMPTSHVFWLIV